MRTALTLALLLPLSATAQVKPNAAADSNTYLGPLNENAYSHPSPALSPLQAMDFNMGNALFRRVWATGLGSARASDGLGPLFNSRSCQRCHIKDGRGHPPLALDEPATSFVIQLSKADSDPQSDSSGDAHYGKQLQPFAVTGLSGEGDISIRYEEQTFQYPDGSQTVLLKPHYSVREQQDKKLARSTVLSPRVAPQMIGLGLLAAIDANDILANADKNDRDNDGISGRANYGYSLLQQKTLLGRFGWKAAAPTLEDQIAAAFATDMGLSTPLINTDYGDCTKKQNDCQREAERTNDNNETSEIKQEIFDLITFYSTNLAVPQSRHKEANIAEGSKLFTETGCAACHTPSYTTMDTEDLPEHLRAQQIHPYTDLLLHDMGDGLADIARSGFAASNEWRTAPLWGIGLAQVVNPKARYLHDGRARTLEEAILWHGGEAEHSRDAFAKLDKADRNQLIQFIGNL